MSPQIKITEVNKHTSRLIYATLISFLLLSCLKREDYPDVPSITFKRMEFEADTNATLYLDFIDGDGNFGLEEGENDNLPDACVKRYNLFIDQYELQDGIWVNVTNNPCANDENTPLYYSVPWAKPAGQIQTQKGEIKIELSTNWYIGLEGPHDTIRFEIYIRDRDQNESNRITTSYYLKP